MQQWYKCPNCGAPVAFGVKFCGNCGAQITGAIQQPEGWAKQSSRQQGSKWDFLKPSGRFSRLQFACFYFVPIIVTAILFGIIQFGLGDSTKHNGLSFWLAVLAGWLIWPWLPFQIYLVIIAGIRRLHDLNKSGWYLLLAFIPIVNIIMILYLLFAPGKVEGNRWLTSSHPV
jgi:uncharacterized membrane protein YhaH (DUF805 family)